MSYVEIALIGSALSLVGSAASAQTVDAPSPTQQQTEQPAPAASREAQQTASPQGPQAAAPDANAIADIVVTATRREERLQRIPVTVTAITGQALSSAGVLDTRQLTQIVPGLTYSRSTSVGLPIIRGVGSTGTGNGDESNVATYIDGVYQADPFSTILELVEIDRVEVLRGPQGTVFGRNATGGLINVITPDPSFTMRGRVQGTYGRTRNDANNVDLRAYLTGPLSDKFAFDVAGLYRHNGGYVKDLIRGGTIGQQRVVDIRGKLLFAPSESAKMILTVEYGDQASSATVIQPVDRNTSTRNTAGVIIPTGPWEASVDSIPRSDYKKTSVSLRTSFDLGTVNLETTGAYINSQVHQNNDNDSTNIALAATEPFVYSKTYSQEIRLFSKGSGPFTWLVGGYAFHLFTGDAPILLYRGTPPGPLLLTTTLEPTAETTSFAGFAEGTLQIAEPLFITVGGRYTTEKRSFQQVSNGVIVVPYSEKRFNKATYRVAVRYQITPTTNIYASYGTGFKSGVYNTTATVQNLVNPETIDAAEFGIKADIMRGLRTNLSIYYYNYKDQQVNSRIGQLFLLQNAASSRLYGGELEVTAIPMAGLNLSGSIAYSHARYRSFPAAQVFTPLPAGGNAVSSDDVSGNVLVRAPELTFNLAPRYQFVVGAGQVQIGGNIFHSSRVYWDFANRFSQKPYTLVSAEVSYGVNDLRFFVSGTNLFNEIVYQQLRVGSTATDALLERPREVRIGAEIRF